MVSCGPAGMVFMAVQGFIKRRLPFNTGSLLGHVIGYWLSDHRHPVPTTLASYVNSRELFFFFFGI